MGRFVDEHGFTLFDWDAKTGRSVWYKEDGGQTHWRTDYPVDQIVKQNAEHRNIAANGWKGDYHQIASIPLNVYHDQLAEAGAQNDDAYLSRWLNNSDNRAFRTKEGQV